MNLRDLTYEFVFNLCKQFGEIGDKTQTQSNLNTAPVNNIYYFITISLVISINAMKRYIY